MNKHATKLTSTTFLAGLMALSLTVTASAQEAVSVDDIIANYVEAVGGLEAHKSLKTRKSEGTITIAAVGTPWRLTVLQKAPDKKHDRIEIPGYGAVTEGCDGNVAWKQEPGEGTQRLVGWELQNKLRDARFLGIIEMMTEGELTYENTHVLRVLRIVPRGARGFDHIDVEMSDYRAIDGIGIPFSIDISVDSNPVATVKFDKVTHGIEVDDALFAMPTS